MDEGGVQAQGIPGCCEDLAQECERRGDPVSRGGRGRFAEAGVLALEIAWARAWLPGGMGGISVMGRERWKPSSEVCQKQSGGVQRETVNKNVGGGKQKARSLTQLLGVSSFFFLYHVLCIQLRGTKTACSASSDKEKTPMSPGCIPPGTMEKAINPCPSGLAPTARQPHKIRNPTLTT